MNTFIVFQAIPFYSTVPLYLSLQTLVENNCINQDLCYAINIERKPLKAENG